MPGRTTLVELRIGSRRIEVAAGLIRSGFMFLRSLPHLPTQILSKNNAIAGKGCMRSSSSVATAMLALARSKSRKGLPSEM